MESVQNQGVAGMACCMLLKGMGIADGKLESTPGVPEKGGADRVNGRGWIARDTGEKRTP
jgi:hypothetical protein